MPISSLRRVRAWRLLLDGALTVSILVLSTTLAWYLVRNGTGPPRVAGVLPRASKGVRRSPPPLPQEPVSLDGAILMGSKEAKLVVVAYSDVQCPFCGTFARETLPVLQQKFVTPGKMLFALRQFPLVQLHPAARQAALAIECSEKQGRAWPMHDRLFAQPQVIDTSSIARIATELGLNIGVFDICMKGSAGAQVDADVASGQALGVTGTPTFFIGALQPDHRVKLVERVPGAVPMSQWERSLNEWLKDMESR